jgi:hypothetical protein
MSLHTEIDETEWPEILRAVQDRLQERIHTSIPCVVRSYNSATQRAEVEFAVQLEAKVPPLADVPVLCPGGNNGVLHVPLAVGDSVLVVFTEEDFAKWDSTGSVSAPAVLQRHGLHAVAIPGLRPAASPFAVTGGHVTLASATELRLGSDTATAKIALEPGVAGIIGDLITALNTIVAALVPTTGVAPGAQTTWLASSNALVARILAEEMAATKVKAT